MRFGFRVAPALVLLVAAIVDQGTTVGGKFLCKRGHPFIGRQDDLRVYSVRMTANEILLCSVFTTSTATECR